jgi:nicotinate-nucleotide pyrophosphorylase (carboxylating)
MPLRSFDGRLARLCALDQRQAALVVSRPVPDLDPVTVALAEDIGAGDLTSTFFVTADRESSARIFAKESAVVAGAAVAERVFLTVDPALRVKVVQSDGALVKASDTVLQITGKTRSILTAERVSLNFIQRLSGIATLTHRFVEQTAGTRAKILDTRKTTPGLRALEKAAVRAGGGRNHRMGLFDGVIVKDNHLLTRPQLIEAVQALKRSHPEVFVEIEADSVDQVREFVQIEGVDCILLDNMPLEDLRASVALRRPGVTFEASGGVSLETVGAIAQTGVDYISAGQLTHSARAIDYSLELLDE